MIYVMSAVIVLAVTGLCLLQNRVYKIAVPKVIILVLIMVVAGVVGVKVFHFVENGHFAGASFYGSVFCVPLALYFAEKPIKVSREVLLDFSGPVFALFLAIVKLGCLHSGCCRGHIMYYIDESHFVRFPSAKVESVFGVIICVVLLLMQRNSKNRGSLFPAFLVIYGVSRFVLNFFRADLGTFRLLQWTGLTIPPGHLWSVICIIWGIVWLYRFRSRACGRKLTMKEFAVTFFGLRPLKVAE